MSCSRASSRTLLLLFVLVAGAATLVARQPTFAYFEHAAAGAISLNPVLYPHDSSNGAAPVVYPVEIDAAVLAAGTYFYKLVTLGRTISGPLIVTH